MVACYRVGQHRESIEMVDRPGDFGGAAMAVAHLPGDPARIAGPGAHNPGDLLFHRSHFESAGARRLEMIDGRIIAEHLCGRGKASLMIDDGVGVENVLLVLILHMDHRVGCRDSFGEGSRRDRFSLRAAISMRGCGKIARAKCFTRNCGVLIDRTRKADTIGARRGAENAQRSFPARACALPQKGSSSSSSSHSLNACTA